MHRRLTLLLALTTSLTACAAEPGSATATVPASVATAASRAAPPPPPTLAKPGVDQSVRATMAKVLPDTEVTSVVASPIAGLAEVSVNGRVFYVSEDGRYLFSGNLIDVVQNRNLTRVREGTLRQAELAKVGPERRIIFAAANPKHRVTVFTDVECGFCRKLHEQMADYNRAGITIEYLFFPRMGPGSEGFEQAVAVACAADKRGALTRSKAGTKLPHANCKNSVAADYALGQRVGVDGTPAIYAEDGQQIGGYLPPAEMVKALDELKAPGAP